MHKAKVISLITAAVLVTSCKPSNFSKADSYPGIYPDYIGVTVPEDMAELHFAMVDGRECMVSTKRDGDTIWYSVSAWKKGAKSGTAYASFPVYISHDPIDPYIAYRLIEPGYESWHDMGIYQRELSSYKEKAIVTNAVNDRGCVNCHTFTSGDPDKMIFHARGVGGGTVFVNALGGKDEVRLVNLAATGPNKQGTYTAWSPDGRYVVFSSNTTHQSFYTSAMQPIEVYDSASDMILMDLETEEVTTIIDSENTLETFPAWSSDGRKLYFCSAENPGNLPTDRTKVRYRLMSMDFENGRFADPETVLDIDSLSISFPRVSGDKLLFTASSFGTFPIWHSETDLWLMDLSNGETRPVEEINSEESDSYHSWSSNGKWIVFSSRRDDGRYTRLYFSHFNEDGTFTKPFMLPQKNAEHNTLRLKSYNIPEFIGGKVADRTSEIEKLFKKGE